MRPASSSGCRWSAGGPRRYLCPEMGRMSFRQAGPAGFVEKGLTEMSITKGAGVGNVGKCETGALEIGFQIVLETEKHGFSRHPPSGLEVGVNAVGVTGILLPVSDLVAVRSE